MGSTVTVDVGPTCTLSNVLSPIGTELCTLLISSEDANDGNTGSFTTVCTIATSSPTVSSVSEQTTVTGE